MGDTRPLSRATLRSSKEEAQGDLLGIAVILSPFLYYILVVLFRAKIRPRDDLLLFCCIYAALLLHRFVARQLSAPYEGAASAQETTLPVGGGSPAESCQEIETSNRGTI